MSNKQYFLISGLLFTLVAIAHLLRVVLGVPVQIDSAAVPMAVSWVGFAVPAALAYWAFRLYRASGAV
jgi:hypothetical protein